MISIDEDKIDGQARLDAGIVNCRVTGSLDPNHPTIGALGNFTMSDSPRPS
jgi:hypothetical protein